MAFWNDSRGLDDLVRTSDRTLNLLVIVLLAAFALGSGAYYYGQLNPRVAPASPSQTAPSSAPTVR
jgi:hypothetical protein